LEKKNNMKRPTRSQSGVCIISIAIDGYMNNTCDFDCSFCPNECKKKGAKYDIARSYLSSEGTFKRGLIDQFKPRKQIWRRLAELEAMNHYPDKLEIIVLGGTWSCLPFQYRNTLIHNIFYACNTYDKVSKVLEGEHSDLMDKWLETSPFKYNLPFDEDNAFESQLPPMESLEDEKKRNENLPHCRIIGIVLETRPDQISKFNILTLRTLGCTRIQVGVQHTDNDILEQNNRGHTVEHSIKALRIMKENCFKVDGHMMPDLPFTTLEKDYEMARKYFMDSDFQLDYVKVYPCLRLPYTKANEWYESGEWKPIAEHNFDGFMEYLGYCLSICPPWTRINRVQRDFPVASEKNEGLGFTSPTIRTNLHQMVTDRMALKGLKCYDIRTREVKNNVVDTSNAKLYIRTYEANGGKEYFLSVEVPKDPSDIDDAYLLGLLRLRLSEDVVDERYLLKTFRKKMAKIRELHVYGFVSGNKDSNVVQHRGIGTFLLHVAEMIAYKEGYREIAVISGVGVRKYYKKLGYTMESSDGDYLIKELKEMESQPTLFKKSYVVRMKRVTKTYPQANGKLYLISPVEKSGLWLYGIVGIMVCVMMYYYLF
jgi:elongator complex protein 3